MLRVLGLPPAMVMCGTLLRVESYGITPAKAFTVTPRFANTLPRITCDDVAVKWEMHICRKI